MAVPLPPVPYGSPPGSSFWNDWYEKLRRVVNDGAISVLWSSINFSGSNITDIASRAHNQLQSFQGGGPGEYYHLTAAQQAKVAALPVGISVTITTAKLTGAGANGSMTFVNGLLTAQTPAT
jgi:hypothetical protein